MDNNRLYWIFIVSLYKITKIIDYNRLKMYYNDNFLGGGHVGGMGVRWGGGVYTFGVVGWGGVYTLGKNYYTLGPWRWGEGVYTSGWVRWGGGLLGREISKSSWFSTGGGGELVTMLF